jgi:hypothetical protein
MTDLKQETDRLLALAPRMPRYSLAVDGQLVWIADDMAAHLRALQAENDRLTAENEVVNDSLRVHTAGSEYAHRLAVMLECALLNRDGTWDDGHALLAEYRRAVRFENEHPTFMGEPAIAMSRERGE